MQLKPGRETESEEYPLPSFSVYNLYISAYQIIATKAEISKNQRDKAILPNLLEEALTKI
jgi:hypothetical protein